MSHESWLKVLAEAPSRAEGGISNENTTAAAKWALERIKELEALLSGQNWAEELMEAQNQYRGRAEAAEAESELRFKRMGFAVEEHAKVCVEYNDALTLSGKNWDRWNAAEGRLARLVEGIKEISRTYKSSGMSGARLDDLIANLSPAPEQEANSTMPCHKCNEPMQRVRKEEFFKCENPDCGEGEPAP